MLRSLDRLSSVTVDTLDAAQDDIVADLKSLEPILQQLARSGEDLPKSLQILLTYPFPDSVLGAIKGDYLNVFIETNFRTLPSGCGAIGCSWPQVEDPNTKPGAASSNRKRPASIPSPSLLPPTDSAIPGMPTPTVPVPSAPIPTPKPSASPSSPAPTTPGPGQPSPTSPGPTGSPSPTAPTPTRDEPSATPTPTSTSTSKDGGE